MRVHIFVVYPGQKFYSSNFNTKILGVNGTFHCIVQHDTEQKVEQDGGYSEATNVMENMALMLCQEVHDQLPGKWEYYCCPGSG